MSFYIWSLSSLFAFAFALALALAPLLLLLLFRGEMENVILCKIIDYGVFFSKIEIFGMLFYSLPIAQLEMDQMLCYFHDSNYQKMEHFAIFQACWIYFFKCQRLFILNFYISKRGN